VESGGRFPVEGQMAAEKAGTHHDQVAREGELGPGRVAASLPRDQGAEEEESCRVSAQRVNCADPAFGARHLRPVAGACDRGRPGRDQSDPDQEVRAAS
jgi:hypothetical protein